MRRDVFQAIADPTRRQIVSMLAQQPLNLNAVADKFEVSRTAISKHIHILTECGLITLKQQGREKICEAQIAKLGEVTDWVVECRKFWNHKLDALELYLDEVQRKEKKKSKKKKDEKGKKHKKNK